jgi:muconate cycloisomerase
LSAISRSLAKDQPQVIDEDPESAARSLAALRSQISVPIIEHVGDFDDAFTLALLANKAVDAINVIPAQAGGLRRAMRLLQLAQAAGMPALLGSTVELGIGTAAALHVAAAATAVTWASDLVGPGLLTADVVEPAIRYESGGLALPPGAGLGVCLSASAMERWQA